MTKTGTPPPAPIVKDDSETLGEWIQSHSRQVGIGAIVVAALGLGTWLWRSASERKSVEASRALAEAQFAFGSGNVNLAQSDLQKVVNRFGGTSAAVQARLLLAQTYYDQKKPAEGLKVLGGVGIPAPFESSFHAIRAAGLEQTGKPAEAAQEYLKASQTAVGDLAKAGHKADAARAFEAAKDTAQATKTWSEMASDETNPLAGEARIRLGELSAKPVSRG